MKKTVVTDALLGVAVGDALGVPVEFKSRTSLERHPVEDMQAFGTHHQPVGTWSDDSSLTFCLAEMLCDGYDLRMLAGLFVNWKEHGYWGAHGRMFDIGIATSEAIDRLGRGVDPVSAGGVSESSNGNGSLMRILPLVFYLRDKPIEERYDIIRDVSSLTHKHPRSVIACFIYLEMALAILQGKNIQEAYIWICSVTRDWLSENTWISPSELVHFSRVLTGKLSACDQSEILSSGYVVHTLEAAIWCLLTTDNYEQAVLKAVNLGEDTDTTGAVVGGLAGLLYGSESIPAHWRKVLAQRLDIEDLGKRLTAKFV